MNNMEEQLWEYIDGEGTAAQRAAMEKLITTNAQAKQQYEELLQLHADVGQVELDEPPMAFAYNVMENIRAAEAAVPLKAGINSRIIWGIAAFFVLTLGGLSIFLLSNINWQTVGTGGFNVPKLPVKISSETAGGIFSGPLMKGFLFFDLIFALFLFDAWLRKRKNAAYMHTKL